MKFITLILSLGLFAIMLVAKLPAAAPQQARPAPHPSTQDPAVLVTPDQMTLWETELSNWGRWGEGDQNLKIWPTNYHLEVNDLEKIHLQITIWAKFSNSDLASS